MFLSYLPFAHLSERVLMNHILGEGGEIGFFLGDFSRFFDDVARLRPTLFSSVSGVLSSVYEEVKTGSQESGPLAHAFFNMAIKGKKKNLRQGKLDHFLYDKLAFKRVHEMFGGRIRALITGGTPIALDGRSFFLLSLGFDQHQKTTKKQP